MNAPATWTPGPWTAEEAAYGQGSSVIVTAAKALICQLTTRNLDKKRCELNARLISAAPDLYTALKAYRTAKPQCECGEYSGCAMATARALADRALAKATGAV